VLPALPAPAGAALRTDPESCSEPAAQAHADDQEILVGDEVVEVREIEPEVERLPTVPGANPGGDAGHGLVVGEVLADEGAAGDVDVDPRADGGDPEAEVGGKEPAGGLRAGPGRVPDPGAGPEVEEVERRSSKLGRPTRRDVELRVRSDQAAEGELERGIEASDRRLPGEGRV
jgi:hypothetical protein